MDCTPWVLGGLWPAELQRATSETALLAEYLKNDLQRIVDSANSRLRAIGEAGLEDPVRQAEEFRVVNVARAFAVLRVESTVRHLRREPLGFQPEMLSLTRRQAPPAGAVVAEPGHQRRGAAEDRRREHIGRDQPADLDSGWVHAAVVEADDAESVDTAVRVEESAEYVEPEAVPDEPALRRSVAKPVEPDRERPEQAGIPPVQILRTAEAEELRLKRLVRFVARQEPGLRWAVGSREDGATLLVTDLAHGWIPPGVKLPEGVELLAPGRRSGNASAMIGPAASKAAYVPGDAFGSFTEREDTDVSNEPRRLEQIEDLADTLAEVTRRRDGLPQSTHTLAAAVAAGAGVRDSEVDVLRVHVDTARYQLLARYPDIDNRLLLNCLLLAATEAVVTGDPLSANYHFAWFEALSGSAVGRWAANG
jgi:hypothetical protein